MMRVKTQNMKLAWWRGVTHDAVRNSAETHETQTHMDARVVLRVCKLSPSGYVFPLTSYWSPSRRCYSQSPSSKRLKPVSLSKHAEDDSTPPTQTPTHTPQHQQPTRPQ